MLAGKTYEGKNEVVYSLELYDVMTIPTDGMDD